MAVVESMVVMLDQSRQELTVHGTPDFPVACYHDHLGKEEVPWHWHEEPEVVLVEKGLCMVAAGSEKYIVREGEGFFVNSGVLHACWDMEQSGCRFHCIVFHPRLLGSVDSLIYQNYVHPLTSNSALETIHLRPHIPWQNKALEAIENTWQAGAREPYGYEIIMRNSLSEAVLALQEHAPKPAGTTSPKAVREGERIKAMLHYIHEHCGEEVKLPMIAQAASISVSECMRCFRNTIGTTPIQYIRQYRIQKAAHLLLNTDLPISDIAQSCGFQDLSYFTKTFREAKGSAPTIYRRNKK